MKGKAGDTIDGRYEIVGEAGLGTFGRVVDCVDLKTSGPTASAH